MIASIRLLVLGCVLGFCYALLSNAFKLLPAMNVLDAVTLGFALGLSALMWTSAFGLAIGAMGFTFAIFFLFASLAIGLAAVVRAVASPGKHFSHRERIERLYPLPQPRRLILHE